MKHAHVLWWAFWAVATTTTAGAQPSTTVYRCPGPPVLYTDALSAQEARDRGCRTIDGAPITIVQTPKPRPQASPASVAGASGGARPPEGRVEAPEQRARDADARRLLEAELRKEQERLAAMRLEFNNGEPERRGDERNYQRYLDRVNDMKLSIQRKEADIEAIRRELSRLPS